MIILKYLKKLLKNQDYATISDFGLILDWNFHAQGNWVSACMPFLVDAILSEFSPLVISTQRQYNDHKRHLKFILSFEPGWAAPIIEYDHRINCCKIVMYSDPHYRPEERRRYFEDNGFDFLLSLYSSPFFFHFKGFSSEKFIHFPWSIPDHLLSNSELKVRSSEVSIFGARESDAYDVRNWCRRQIGITSYDFSGVENKKMSNEEYYHWLKRFDAVVAAGSSNPIYNLVTPKYFEIAASGALLIGQYCDDLQLLGFDETNCLIFKKQNFNDKIARYRQQPEAYLALRNNGRALIGSRHKVSDRIRLLRELYNAA